MNMLVSIALAAYGIAVQPPAAPREIQVTIHLQDGLGQPIASRAIAPLDPDYLTDPNTVLDGQRLKIVTNATGDAILKTKVDPDVDYLDFGLVGGYWPRTVGFPAADSANAATVSLLERWAFADATRVMLPNTQSSYSATIAGVPGRAIRCTVLNASRAVDWKDVDYGTAQWLVQPTHVAETPPNTIRLVGLPRYQTSLVTVGVEHRQLIFSVPALPTPPTGSPAPETVPDLDLGTITVPDNNAGVPLTATIVAHSDPKVMEHMDSWSGASFIRDDGQLICDWYTNGKASLSGPRLQLASEATGKADDLPRIPPGRYYILPQAWMPTDRQWHFLRLLRANALPTNSGIPTITVAEGQASAAVSINPEPIDAALKTLLNTPVPATP